MIKLKARPNTPKSLKSKKVLDAKKHLKKKVRSGQKPTVVDFPNYWIPEAREILWEHQKCKCAYCERKRELKRESDLEHYRPKAEIEEDPEHFGYWWLAYSWKNYLYSCKPCNQGGKMNKFPLLPSGKRANAESDLLKNEHPILLNPFDDSPEELIGFNWEDSNDLFVKAVPTTKDSEGRGLKTIEILGLNRDTLPEERASFLLTLEALATTMKASLYFAEHGQNLSDLITSTALRIKSETSSEKSFAGFRRAYFRKFGLGNYCSND